MEEGKHSWAELAVKWTRRLSMVLLTGAVLAGGTGLGWRSFDRAQEPVGGRSSFSDLNPYDPRAQAGWADTIFFGTVMSDDGLMTDHLEERWQLLEVRVDEVLKGSLQGPMTTVGLNASTDPSSTREKGQGLVAKLRPAETYLFLTKSTAISEKDQEDSIRRGLGPVQPTNVEMAVSQVAYAPMTWIQIRNAEERQRIRADYQRFVAEQIPYVPWWDRTTTSAPAR